MTIQEIRRVVTNIINILGPNYSDCEVNICLGCKQEVADALALAKDLLEQLKDEEVS